MSILRSKDLAFALPPDTALATSDDRPEDALLSDASPVDEWCDVVVTLVDLKDETGPTLVPETFSSPFDDSELSTDVLELSVVPLWCSVLRPVCILLAIS